MSSRLVAGLLITNVTTLACVALWGSGAWGALKRRLQRLLEFNPRLRTSSENTQALGELLGRDYVPPLPEPVAHVRSDLPPQRAEISALLSTAWPSAGAQLFVPLLPGDGERAHPASLPHALHIL